MDHLHEPRGEELAAAQARDVHTVTCGGAMKEDDVPQRFDAPLKREVSATATEAGKPAPVTADWPSGRVMDGPLAESTPAAVQDGPGSDIRPHNDTRQDTRAASPDMASNTEKNAPSGFDEAERLWLRASPYNLH